MKHNNTHQIRLQFVGLNSLASMYEPIYEPIREENIGK